MGRPKDLPQHGGEPRETRRRSPRGISTGGEPPLEVGLPRRRESLTAPEVQRVRTALAKAFKPIDLVDESFDTVIPTSLEAVEVLLDTGYLPSLTRGGFFASFSRIEL